MGFNKIINVKIYEKYLTKGFSCFQGEPTLTALDVRRQKEEELRKNDVYWQNRLQQQELNLQKTNAILEKEYNETVTYMFCL